MILEKDAALGREVEDAIIRSGGQARCHAATWYVSDATGNDGDYVSGCIIVSNFCSGAAGGIYFDNTNSSVYNSIVWSNSPTDIDKSSTIANQFLYSCASSMGGLTETNGSITGHPQFTDWASANYRPAKTSPCINAGTNQAWMTGAADLDGHQRIDRYYRRIVDMGAYEFIPKGTIFIGH